MNYQRIFSNLNERFTFEFSLEVFVYGKKIHGSCTGQGA